MTSEERREARYRRRKAKRDAKRRSCLEKHGGYDRIITRSALSRAAKEATRGVIYKGSVKRYMLRRLTNVEAVHERLEKRQDVRKGFICFHLIERGKRRDIMSVHFSERVPQKSLNQNAMLPVFTRSLIYDNGASLAGKGTSFAIRRMTTLLRRHYRKYGNEGYVLSIDIHDYFGNIDHETAKQMIAEMFDDQDVIHLADQFIDAYYEYRLRAARDAGEDLTKVSAKGLGLGSETNQTIAVLYLNRVDHYIKEMLRIKAYERYMDDLQLISNSKEELEESRIKIEEMLSEIGLSVNPKKTRITKLSHGFTFLKTRFYLTDTGKVLRRPCRDAFTRERRRLKKHKKLVDAGEMTKGQAQASYASWHGSVEKKQARRSIYNMEKLYQQLFDQGGHYG